MKASGIGVGTSTNEELQRRGRGRRCASYRGSWSDPGLPNPERLVCSTSR